MSALVELARCDRPYQADLARMFLESHSVEAVVFDTNSYIYSEGALVGVRLMVLDEDLAEARKALRSYKP